MSEDQAPLADKKTPPQRSQQEQAKLEAEVRTMFDHNISFNKYLGFSIESLTNDQVAIAFDMRPELIGHFLHGRLHGGVISSVLDVAGGLAVLWAVTEYHDAENVQQVLERFAHLGTVDLRVDYLRQGIGTRFIATSQVIKLGRRIATVQMQLVNEEKTLIATGAATYVVN